MFSQNKDFFALKTIFLKKPFSGSLNTQQWANHDQNTFHQNTFCRQPEKKNFLILQLNTRK